MITNEQKRVFSRNLCSIMEERHITQTKLAEDCHFIRQSVSSWVCGKAMPRMDKIQILADYFNVQKSDLIEDNGLYGTTDIYTKIRRLNEEGMNALNVYVDFLLLNEGNVK